LREGRHTKKGKGKIDVEHEHERFRGGRQRVCRGLNYFWRKWVLVGKEAQLKIKLFFSFEILLI